MQVSLKAARVNAELTQVEVANALGWSVDTVKNIETGKRDLKVVELAAMCDLYHCRFDDIILPDGTAFSGIEEESR